METLEAKIRSVVEQYASNGYLFNEGASDSELASFIARCQEKLGHRPPSEYLEVLKRFDGMVVEGVFLYSTTSRSLAGTKSFTLDFLEMNMLSREDDFMTNFLFFGDSDQDVYVFDILAGEYQVRDKQAFDNVYEQFYSFSGLLAHMVDLMLSRV